MKYKRGSIWRKWDLHTHTPIDNEWINKPDLSTDDLKEEFATKYIKKAKEQGLGVIAITDHNFCNNLGDLLLPFIQNEGQREGISVLPGFEVTAKDGSGIHLLCIFPLKTHHERIKQIVDQLFKPGEILVPANGQIPVSTKTIEEIFQIIQEAKLDAVLIFAHADSTSGVLDKATIKGARRLDEWHKKYIGIAQISRPLEEYDKTSGIYQMLSGQHPDFKRIITYICASDCRAIEDTKIDGRTCLGQKFVWIKADPTLEGLKQIIEEPERAKIQEENPYNEVNKYFINEIKITNENGYILQSQSIPLNRDMVCIIGGKGTGKSLLLSVLAHVNNDGGDHFTNVSQNGEAQFEYEVIDKSGTATCYSSSTSSPLNNQLPIYHVEQEYLATIAKNKNEVRAIVLDEIGIESISTNYNNVIASIQTKITAIIGLRNNLSELYRDFCSEHEDDFKVESVGNFEAHIETKIADLTAKKEKLSTPETKKLIDKLSDIVQEGTLLKTLIQSNSFPSIKSKLEAINKEIESLNNSTKAKLPGAQDIESIDIDKIDASYQTNIHLAKEKLDKLRVDFQKKKQQLVRLDIKEDITALTTALEKIQKQISTFEELKRKVIEQKKTIDKLKEEISLYFTKKDEIAYVGNSIPILIEESKEKVNEVYHKFLNENNQSKYFEKIFTNINIKGEVYFEIELLISDLESCFYNHFDINIKSEVFKDCTYQEYFSWLSEKSWSFLFSNEKKIQKSNYEKLIRLLFEKWPSYIKVQPKIEATFGMKTKELKNMSTGEQATLLLKLFLATKGQQASIILLDQPEDHLDNDFITDELLQLLKVVKKYKQLIIATHNANIVVGGDAEQVIVAQLDKELEKDQLYISGALENPVIKECVITTLEGGEIAFEKRRRKYNFKD